jgi:hypothetical protein
MARDPESKVLVGAAATAVGVGTAAYPLIEGWSLLDSLYFSVVTLATVGFGDLHPTTDFGKLFTVFYIIAGIGILAAFASTLTKYVEFRPGGRAAAAISSRHGGPVEEGAATQDSGPEDDVKT